MKRKNNESSILNKLKQKRIQGLNNNGKRLCAGLTKRNKPCSRLVTENHMYCVYHNDSKQRHENTLIKPEPVSNSISNLSQKLIALIKVNAKQPEQRTEEWYKQRKECLTASAIAIPLKITRYEYELMKKDIVHFAKDSYSIGNQANTFGTISELIQSKALPENQGWEGNAWTRWGVKYEPVITAAYSYYESCNVMEFGLMPHHTIPWLGASPDGITNKEVMVEIKAPFKRKINGIPSLHYWSQMQIQMECCDIDLCDFVEVEIEEYEDVKDFDWDCLEKDGKPIYNLSKNGLPKGIVIEHKKIVNGKQKSDFFYPPPFYFKSKKEEEDWLVKWSHDFINKDKNNAYNFLFYDDDQIENHRWRFIKYSCVSIKRDKIWFARVKPVLEAFWNDILEYRKSGIPEKYSKITIKEESNYKPTKPPYCRPGSKEEKRRLDFKNNPRKRRKKKPTNKQDMMDVCCIIDDSDTEEDEKEQKKEIVIEVDVFETK